jgi:hypothetical protein
MLRHPKSSWGRLACKEAGVTPVLVPFANGDPVRFVVSENLKRRHLDESQRGMVGARLAKMQKGRPENAPNGVFKQSDAGELLNVGKRTIQRGRKVVTEGITELQSAVEEGKISISTAAALACLPKNEQLKTPHSRTAPNFQPLEI